MELAGEDEMSEADREKWRVRRGWHNYRALSQWVGVHCHAWKVVKLVIEISSFNTVQMRGEMRELPAVYVF